VPATAWIVHNHKRLLHNVTLTKLTFRLYLYVEMHVAHSRYYFEAQHTGKRTRIEHVRPAFIASRRVFSALDT
jgi:hypothetical protein